MRWNEQESAQQTVKRADDRTESILAPAVHDGTSRLDQLVARRIALETARSDEAQASNLRYLRTQIEKVTNTGATASQDWEPLPPKQLREFCDEIETVLEEWKWEGEGRVEFDEAEYDIKVDGQQRQSHGKGVRAVLYSAFVIGLLRYCYSKGRPHPGTVVIDSPLTSYKKGKSDGAGDVPVSTGIELAFWASLRRTQVGTQIIIIENKEPPQSVAASVRYEWFAGKNAQLGERRGFIPAPG
jgi:hypothetical protein